jgi:hypothetical protein
MKAYSHNGRVVFLPLAGSTPVEVVHETDRSLAAGEEAGAVQSVHIGPDGKAHVVRKPRHESARTKARRELETTNSIPRPLRDAILALIS